MFLNKLVNEELKTLYFKRDNVYLKQNSKFDINRALK